MQPNLPQIRPLFMQKNILKYLTVLLLGSATLFVSCDKKAGDNKTTTTTADSSATKVAEAQPADTTKTDTLAAAAEKKEPVGGGQGSNYGYINSLELLSKMPEIKAADRKLEALAKQKEASFKALMQKYQDLGQSIQANAENMTRVESEAKMKEIGELEQKLQAMQANSQEELAIEKEKLYAPILKKADAAIKKVGEEGHYAFIYDSSAGVLLYADTTKNILPIVSKKLGLK